MPERCNYSQIKETYGWITEPNKKCIISPDLDGLLSSILLSNFLKWQVVGIYTVNELYLAKNHLNIQPNQGPEEIIISNNLVFVDHDIYRKDILSVGHHLLQWSENTPIPNHTEGNNSLNPNLLRKITKQEFNRKYPYGTFHFLLACFSAWGFLKDFNPDDELTTLLLHIDSSFESSIKYQDNAIDWLDWLGGSDELSPRAPICRRMLRFNPRIIIEQFKALADRFEEFGLPPRRQATFDNPSDRDKWTSITRLIEWVNRKTGWSQNIIEFPDEEFVTFRIRRESDRPNRGIFERIIEQNPFSYAIISSGDDGFNYGWLET